MVQLWVALLALGLVCDWDGGERRPGLARVVERGRASAGGGGVVRGGAEGLAVLGWLMGPGAPRRTVAAGVCAREWVYLPSVRPVEAFVGGGG